MKIGKKLFLAFALMVFLIVATAALFFASIQHSLKGIDVLDEELRESDMLSKIEIDIYALHNNLEHCATYQVSIDGEEAAATVARIEENLALLSAAMKRPSLNGENHESREEETISAIGGELSAIREVVRKFSSVKKEDREALLQSIHNTFEHVAGIIAQFNHEDHGEIVRAFKTARRVHGQGISILIFGVSATIVIAVISAWLFHRSIAPPIERLQEEVNKIAGGDFTHKLPASSSDEIGLLSKSVNEMADNLHMLYTDLERKVDEKTHQLVRAEKLAGLGKIAAGLAHEINNPLGPAAACAESMYERLKKSPNPSQQDIDEFKQYLATIIEGVYRCKTVTEQMLNIARPRPPRMERCDLRRIIDNALSLLDYLAKSKSVAVTATRSGTAEPILADPSQLQQLFFNLIGNGLDAVGRNGNVRITTAWANDSVTVSVEDDGCGIPAAVKERLFEPFFTTKPPGKGTGLGLAVCNTIAQLHDGSITVESDGEKKGARFIVKFPVTPEDRR